MEGQDRKDGMEMEMVEMDGGWNGNGMDGWEGGWMDGWNNGIVPLMMQYDGDVKQKTVGDGADGAQT